MNSLSRAIRELEDERARLEVVIRSLRSLSSPGAGRGRKRGRPPKMGRSLYRLSPEGRQRIADAARKRWAKERAAKKSTEK